MGACLSHKVNANNGPVTEPPLYSNISLGPQENMNKECYASPLKNEPSNVTAESSHAKFNSKITLSDGQTSDIFDLPSCLRTSVQLWTEQHNEQSKSVIIKKGDRGKKKQPSSVQNTKKTIQSVQQEEHLQADCITQRQNDRFTKFTISSKEFDIEFTLPRSRAGPLVVPYIDFDRYCLIQGQ